MKIKKSHLVDIVIYILIENRKIDSHKFVFLLAFDLKYLLFRAFIQTCAESHFLRKNSSQVTEKKMEKLFDFCFVILIQKRVQTVQKCVKSIKYYLNGLL